MTTTLANQLPPNPILANGGSMQSAQVVTLKELETKLLSLFSDQEIIMTGTDDASEIEPFKAAEEAFEKLVDAEVAFEMARAGMITGNGRRMLEARLKSSRDIRFTITALRDLPLLSFRRCLQSVPQSSTKL